MNYRTTLLLLCVLIAVGIALLFVNRGDDETKTATDRGEAKLFDIESKDITKLTITPADGKRMALEKKGADWRMLEPVSAAADTWAVDSLVRGLSDLRSRGQIELTSENASTTNLNPPRYQVELEAGPRTIKLKVGARSTIGDNLYVQLDGRSKADVVSASVCDDLEKPFTSYRQTKLVSAAATDIKQIEITRPDGKLVLNKTAQDWQIVAPEKMPAESAEISDLAAAITGLNATEFVNETDIPAQLLPKNNPRTTVWFSTAAPATQPTTQPAGITLRFGGYDTVLKQNVYVSVSDPAALAKVPATTLDRFNKKPLDLRDKSVLKIDPAQVSRLSIVTNKPATTQPTTQPASRTELVIERKKQTVPPTTNPTTNPTTLASTQPATVPALPPTNWTLKAAPDADASQAEVDSLLNKFSPLRADKYLAGPFPTTQPIATYTIQLTLQPPGSPDQVVHTIQLIDPGDAKPLVGQYNNLVFELPSTFITDLTRDFANKPELPKMPAGPGMPGMPGMGME